MTIEGLRQTFVVPFPTSPTRQNLFNALASFVKDLEALGICLELSINGSFVCDKNDPEDIDLSVSFFADDTKSLSTSQINFLTVTLNGTRIYGRKLHSFLAPAWRRDDPRFGADRRRHWGSFWGIGRDDWLKGYAVIDVGVTDVQRRLIA